MIWAYQEGAFVQHGNGNFGFFEALVDENEGTWFFDDDRPDIDDPEGLDSY